MRLSKPLIYLSALAVIATPAVSQGFLAESTIPIDGAFGGFIAPGQLVDVDGDGLADVVCGGSTDSYSTNVAVLRGRADGSLDAPIATNFIGPGTPARLGDFNADGRTDLWSYSTFEDALKVRLGQADGTFASNAAATLALSAFASDFLVCDIDGDGDADTIWSEKAGTRIHIVESVGGALVEVDQLVGPQSPKDLAFGDVTGNGFGDVVVSTVTGVAVFEGTTGDFGTSLVVPALGPALNDVQLADVRGDTTLDIVLSEGGEFPLEAGSRLWVYEGGSGLFAAPAATLLDTSGDPIRQWLLADTNSDGLDDIIVAASRLTVELQGPAGTFATSSRQLRGSSFSLADITRDGNPDIIVFGVNDIAVREGHEQGVFEGSIGFSSAFEMFSTGDMNGDGLEDVVAVTDNEIDVHFGAPSGGFSVETLASSTTHTVTAALTDMDVDGDLDVLVVVANDVLRFANDGTGTLVAQAPQSIASTTSASIGDFTGDGLDDVFVVSVINDDVFLYEGTNGGPFIETNLGDLGFTPNFSTVADVDSDGVADVIYIDDAQTTAITLGGFVGLGAGGSAVLRGFAFADFENDGELEMLLAQPSGTTSALGFQVRRPNGLGQFVDDVFIDTGLTSVSFKVADLDDDGDDDVVLIDDPTSFSLSRRLSTWIDDGAGALAETSEIVTTGFKGVVIDDVDGDGLVDALLGVFADARLLSNASGPWTELGQSLAGSSGLSGLDGRGALTASGEIELIVTSAPPNSASTLVVGLSQLAAPFKGGVLVPSPDLILPGPVTDAFGAATLPSTEPSDLPAGIELFLQVWFVEGPGDFAATTGLRGVTY